jgi:transposase
VAEKRRRLDPEFRAGAVRIVLETGKPIAQVARDLGVNVGTLGNWVNQAKAASEGGSGGLSETEREELARLRRENAELAMERDVLNRSVVLWGQGGDEVSVAASIGSQRTEHGVPHAVSCRALGLSESWFYKWHNHEDAAPAGCASCGGDQVPAEETVTDAAGIVDESAYPRLGHVAVGGPVVEPAHQRRLVGHRQTRRLGDLLGQALVELAVVRRPGPRVGRAQPTGPADAGPDRPGPP